MEDDKTIDEMRGQEKKERLRRQYMSPGELVNIRTHILRVKQVKLIEQLINPATGEPCTQSAYCRWEKGRNPIPLWVARRVRDLAEAAKRFDAKRT